MADLGARAAGAGGPPRRPRSHPGRPPRRSAGRAASVVAFAPAGGWDLGDPSSRALLDTQAELHVQTASAVVFADRLMASAAGRRRATRLTTVSFEHFPPELLAAQLRGVAGCEAGPLLAWAQRSSWRLDAARVSCPVRIAWGTEDALLPWPRSAVRFRRDWLPQADWIQLDGVGLCPQLDVPLEAAQLIFGHTASVSARSGARRPGQPPGLDHGERGVRLVRMGLRANTLWRR